METKELYRMLANGEEEWRGVAWSMEHAEERCFYHEEPNHSTRYTLQKWSAVNFTKEIKGNDWKTIYENALLR